MDSQLERACDLYIPWVELPLLLGRSNAELNYEVMVGLLVPGIGSPEIYGRSVHISSVVDYIFRKCLVQHNFEASDSSEVIDSLCLSGRFLCRKESKEPSWLFSLCLAVFSGDGPLAEAFDSPPTRLSARLIRGLRNDLRRELHALIARITCGPQSDSSSESAEDTRRESNRADVLREVVTKRTQDKESVNRVGEHALAQIFLKG